MSESNPNRAEVEARFNLVKQRYGDRLTAEEEKKVKKDVEDIVDAAEAMRAVKLDNADEPLSLFVPYRRDE